MREDIFIKMTGMKVIGLYEDGEADEAARYVIASLRARIAERGKHDAE